MLNKQTLAKYTAKVSRHVKTVGAILYILEGALLSRRQAHDAECLRLPELERDAGIYYDTKRLPKDSPGGREVQVNADMRRITHREGSSYNPESYPAEVYEPDSMLADLIRRVQLATLNQRMVSQGDIDALLRVARVHQSERTSRVNSMTLVDVMEFMADEYVNKNHCDIHDYATLEPTSRPAPNADTYDEDRGFGFQLRCVLDNTLREYGPVFDRAANEIVDQYRTV